MANPQYNNNNGIAPQFDRQAYPQPGTSASSTGAGTGAYQQRDVPKPFTLNEALPYTPFTSVFPFEPGRLIPPSVFYFVLPIYLYRSCTFIVLRLGRFPRATLNPEL